MLWKKNFLISFDFFAADWAHLVSAIFQLRRTDFTDTDMPTRIEEYADSFILTDHTGRADSRRRTRHRNRRLHRRRGGSVTEVLLLLILLLLLFFLWWLTEVSRGSPPALSDTIRLHQSPSRLFCSNLTPKQRL